MEVPTAMERSSNSESSDSDAQAGEKLIDFSHLQQDTKVIDKNLELMLNLNKSSIQQIEVVLLNHNKFFYAPENIAKFINLKVLDLSSTGIRTLPDAILQCPLSTFLAKNNNLTDESLPKYFSTTLKEVNLTGNRLGKFPPQLLALHALKFLYLGNNCISEIPKDIWKLTSLQIMSLGKNQICEVPSTVGDLSLLRVLILCENKIRRLPPNIANLKRLKSLHLHNNLLMTLPTEIVTLKNLTELSIKENPLVVRFVSDMTNNHRATSLMELSARIIKLYDIKYNNRFNLPDVLISYLDSGHRCVNPQCKGVFFDNRVEHIKFVDFCGKYRIPLLQYLCSSKCAKDDSPNHPPDRYMLRKVLLG